MSLQACIVVLLLILAPASNAPEWWTQGGQAPVKIWSINAELDMDQQTADVNVLGPKNVQVERNEQQYRIHLDSPQQQVQEPHDESAVIGPLRDAEPSTRGPMKTRTVVAIKSACCQGCEAPSAVHLVHALAHSLGMVVVLLMWMLLTLAILIRFR